MSTDTDQHRVVRQGAWFLVVGVFATFVHAVVALSLMDVSRTPAAANVLGWLAALTVSFLGHYHLTFRHAGARLGVAAARFLVTSLALFGANAACYAALLRGSVMSPASALLLVLVGQAVLSFCIGRAWAFKRAA